MLLRSLLTALLLIGCRSEKLPEDTGTIDTVPSDPDGDGFDATEDCDDQDGAIYPGAEEICDGIDNNCDGSIDEGVTGTFYADTDSDGFGDEAATIEGCEAPSGYVSIPNDCDDTDADSYPGAAERCDGADNDCDGDIDEDVLYAWYADADGDGFGDPGSEYETCDPPPGYTDDASDCDDTEATAFPGGVEVCDEVDNDCDGDTDEGVTATWYQDTDGDAFGVADVTTAACDLPTGYAAEPGDCDDTDGAISPNAVELCDEVDNDCDGETDEDDAADVLTWYTDADADGYGNPDDPSWACSQPSGAVADDTDCDDAESAASPGAVEVCDSIDNDCDGETDEDSASDASTWYADSDGDGYGGTSSTTACDQPSGFADNSDDCDDGEAASNPGESEVCDDIDNDCDGDIDEGLTDTYYLDYDGDGYGDADKTTEACSAPSGYTADATDCDDTEAAANPGESEVCDDIDNDCDGDTDEGLTATYYFDYDGDGYGSPDTSTEACSEPSGYVSDGTDCDDLDADNSPDGEEVCDEVDNDCDGQIDEDTASTETFYADADGDGFGDPDTTAEACSVPSGYTEDDADCDDSDATVNPDAAEVADGQDNDCDGAGLDGDYSATTDADLAGGVWEFTDLSIASGVSITVTGSSALEIYVLGDVTVDGSLLLDGEGGTSHGTFGSSANSGGDGGGGGGSVGGAGACYNCGSGAVSGSGDAPGGGADSGMIGGGGGGGGSSTAGDVGSDGTCTASRCGSVYTVAGGAGGADLSSSTPELQAGSGGGGGGYGVADNGDGGGGGGGGGALFLMATGIDVSGSIDCSGGGGGSDGSGYDGGSGGGGSGGTLWLVAETLSVSGDLLCEGGPGGTTVVGGTTAQGGDGGDGADGVIWVDVDSSSITGTVSPGATSVP